MPPSHNITLLGAGLIGTFYAMTIQGQRSRDRISTICALTEDEAHAFARRWGIPKWTASMAEAVNDLDSDIVIIGVPNYLHKKAVTLAAKAGKAVLCTKPLARNAREALEIMEIVDKAGVFAGYLEDLVYTPKTLKSIVSVKRGALGKILWVRSRETHSGPHSAWFWDRKLAGGGAIVDLACHCIEIIRSFIGKRVRPLEAMCLADTMVHPIAAEDSAIALIRFENQSIGQFEVSWAFRGGMDLRDEVAGTEGTIWLNHFLRTGYEMFTAAGGKGYVAEKAESETGWLFPVGDEVHELGYTNMFSDMFDSLDAGRKPVETFLDGYIVNAIMDTCYRSARTRRWEPVKLERWYKGVKKAKTRPARKKPRAGYSLIKEERMPDGTIKRLLQDWKTGRVVQRIRRA